MNVEELLEMMEETLEAGTIVPFFCRFYGSFGLPSS